MDELDRAAELHPAHSDKLHVTGHLPIVLPPFGHRKAIGQVIFLGADIFWPTQILEHSWLGQVAMSF